MRCNGGFLLILHLVNVCSCIVGVWLGVLAEHADELHMADIGSLTGRRCDSITLKLLLVCPLYLIELTTFPASRFLHHGFFYPIHHVNFSDRLCLILIHTLMRPIIFALSLIHGLAINRVIRTCLLHPSHSLARA